MHEVGQIIFLVSRKSQSILAAQICEQNVKKTLDGEETTFRVKIGGEDVNDGIYDLSKIDADIYGSPEEASASLYEAAKLAIDGFVADAVEDAKQSFAYQPDPTKKTRGRTRKSTTTPPKASTPKKRKTTKKTEPDPAATYVTMPDGTQARLKTPVDMV